MSRVAEILSEAANAHHPYVAALPQWLQENGGSFGNVMPVLFPDGHVGMAATQDIEVRVS